WSKSALSSSRDSRRLSSMVLMARARARTSPVRMRSTQDWSVVGIFALCGESILQQLPRDHQALDLAGALADGAELHIAIKLFRRVVLDKAVAAVDLYAFVGRLHRHLAGIKLGHG